MRKDQWPKLAVKVGVGQHQKSSNLVGKRETFAARTLELGVEARNKLDNGFVGSTLAFRHAEKRLDRRFLGAKRPTLVVERLQQGDDTVWKLYILVRELRSRAHARAGKYSRRDPARGCLGVASDASHDEGSLLLRRDRSEEAPVDEVLDPVLELAPVGVEGGRNAKAENILAVR